MNWREKANVVLEKIKKYTQDTEGWKECKNSKDVTIWWKPSPDWNGALYKGESIVDASPETVFRYVDPNPNGPRSRWDKAVKELQVVERIDQEVMVLRTVTHSAFGGLISSRDFIDIVNNVSTNEYIATCAQGTEHSDWPAKTDIVRGTNLPCAIICYRIDQQPDKTRVVTYIQTNLGGMLPKSLVESALPSNQVDFFTALKKALADDGITN